MEKEIETCALAYNLRYDSRVSVEREEAIEQYWRSSGSLPVKDFLNEYKLHLSKAKHFADQELNKENLPQTSPETAYQDRFPSEGHDLARILNVTRLQATFNKDLGQRLVREYATLAGIDAASIESFGRSVDQRLDPDRSDLASRKLFIEELLAFLNQFNTQKPYQPLWATTWHHLAAKGST